jgi:hypothetical protein
VTPDYAQIMNRVTIRAKTVKEATDANSKVMAAITAALLEIRGCAKGHPDLAIFQSSRFMRHRTGATQGAKAFRV